VASRVRITVRRADARARRALARYPSTVTHEYTILTGGLVLPGPEGSACSAIAWADAVILAIGADEEVRAISRGDSHFHELRGMAVVPLGAGDRIHWPPDGRLEVGGPADMALLDGDPRSPSSEHSPPGLVAVIRGGHVRSGRLPPA
jgi:hypothetical protein